LTEIEIISAICSFFLDMISLFDKIPHISCKISFPDKAKPSVRRGRKAAVLIKSKMAELPKDEPKASRPFFWARGYFLSPFMAFSRISARTKKWSNPSGVYTVRCKKLYLERLRQDMQSKKPKKEEMV
jgi:hypothetical protein